MNTGAHLQFGWLIGHAREFTRAERAAITLAAVAPDLDGLTFLAGGEVFYRYHHLLLHNVLVAVAYAAVVGTFFSRRALVLTLCLASFLSHLLIDYVTAPWEMAPFWPFSPLLVNLGGRLPKWVVQYLFQFAGMAGILACTVWLYLRYGRTPLEVISPRLDRLLLGYIVLPWKNRCATCNARAHFRCDRCSQVVCGRHWTPCGLGGLCPSCSLSAGTGSY